MIFHSLSAIDPFLCDGPDGVALDTDDPNTPIALPPWSVGTDVIEQSASVPTAPPDDFGCSPNLLRSPSINYDLVGPNGERYTNVNPSGNLEWELFNISTEPFDPALYDIEVPDIPGGVWCLEVYGNDLRNLNSFRLPFDMYGIDEEGNPVLPPEPPIEPKTVPTLSEWGLIAMAAILGIVGFMVIRRRAVTT